MENSEISIKKKEPESLQKQPTHLTKFEDFRDYIDTLLKSKAVPEWVKSPEIAFMMMEYGKSRGFSPIDSLHFVTPVNGVMSTNAKGVGFLLKDAGYTFREIRRAQFIYSYGEKEVYSQRVLQFDEVVHRLSITPEEWSSFDAAKKERISSARDRVTTLEYGIMKGVEFIKLGEHSYFWSDAVQAGLTTKDTYLKYTADMMMHRCKVGLSKVLGILSGSDSEELAVVHDIPYSVVNGEPVISITN